MSALVTFGIVLLAAAGPDAVDVSVTLEPPVVPFHKQAEFRITIEAPADLDVHLDDMTAKFGGLLVYGPPQRNTKQLRHDRRRIVETYTLDPVFIGDYAIEPVEVTWAEGARVVVPSPAIRVRDLTPEEREEAETFAPNAGLIYPKESSALLWVILIAAAGAATLALATAYYWRRRATHAPEAPPRPAWEIAYERLRALDERQLPQAGKIGPYYVDLSAILRYYIEDRFQLHAPERTTPEFLEEAAASHRFSDDHRQLVAGILRHSDRVKFAQYLPSVTEMERCFAEVLRFVDETVPQPETQEAAA
ncbi:MAG TPA: hypothetical protein HPP77_04775 [Candidatus Hydrogenedentes bacterium]|nr:hypothetical protein [Candidatus Hydrogenedentota bacterium]HIJ74970.1 hypothetical protein [Candidatus Hydrogenedentota bacterium]